MALLKAYCDASFTHGKRVPGWTAVGGYVGTESAWSEVGKLWTENKQLWGLDEFSVAKILAGNTPVGHTNAKMCVLSFGSIIRKSELEGVSAAIKDEDWELAYKSLRFPNRYHSCLSLLLHILDQHVSLEYRGDTVEVVLDRDQHPDDALDALCRDWRNESRVITSIMFGRRTIYPLLECADLCAGAERNAQIAGGWETAVHGSDWFSTSFAHRHRGSLWSFEHQKRVDEALERRKDLRKQQGLSPRGDSSPSA